MQRILRHSDVRTTTGICGHLLVEDLRHAVAAIAPNALAQQEPPPFAASLPHGSPGSGAAEIALLDVGEVATRLGVCRDTVYELCKRGELRHVRVLNAIRVHPADLAAFMAGKQR